MDDRSGCEGDRRRKGEIKEIEDREYDAYVVG